ncbi:MAG: hypothetical protein MUC47_03385 [Candidatus Kapabacteria bacterium]|nr:hypothetical protein [Candidatus Kapabacteria bacterium]
MKTIVNLAFSCAAVLFIGCGDDDPGTSITPVPETVRDSTRFAQVNDTMRIAIVKENSSQNVTRSFALNLGTKSLYDVTFTAENVSKGRVTLRFLRDGTSTWEHSFTADPQTWVVNTTVVGPASQVFVGGDTATARVFGTIIGR